jgi:hypothetical protein
MHVGTCLLVKNPLYIPLTPSVFAVVRCIVSCISCSLAGGIVLTIAGV